MRETQDAFRRANDEIAACARELEEEGRTPFLCECNASRCTRIVELTLREYEEVRADEGRHLIAPGHPLADDEHVLVQSERYWVTERRRGGVRHISASA